MRSRPLVWLSAAKATGVNNTETAAAKRLLLSFCEELMGKKTHNNRLA